MGNFNMKVNTGQKEEDEITKDKEKQNQNNMQNVLIVQVTNYLVTITENEEDAAIYFKFKYDTDEIILLDPNQSYSLSDNKYMYFCMMLYKKGDRRISLLQSPLDLSNKNNAFSVYESSEFIRNIKVINTPAGRMIYIADELKYLKECQIEIVNNIPKISETTEYFVHPYFLGEMDFSVSNDGAIFTNGE